MASKPLNRSGWCLKLPITQYNQAEHDGCYKNFMSSICQCDCDHKGERSLESRETIYQPYVPPKALVMKKDDDD